MPDAPNPENTWQKSLKDQTVWFIFAIILAGATSYFQTRISVSTVETNLANAEDKIENIESKLGDEEKSRQKIKIQLEKIDQKIDLLLQLQGIEEGEAELGKQKNSGN